MDSEASSDQVIDADVILERVDKIHSILRTHASEAEHARRLSQSAVDALRWAGVFRMAMPKAWGGPELDPCTQVKIVENVARADASAAWCTMIGSESGFFASYLAEPAARRLYTELDMVTAGFQAPNGVLDACEGGYRLSGRWTLGSGVNHADVIMGGALVHENGKPRSTASGRPDLRLAFLPAAQWQILDTWNPNGLEGSGSHDYTIENAFVPEDFTLIPGQTHRSEPLYNWYGLSVASGIGVVLGTAQQAFDTALEMLETKTSKATLSRATEESTVRSGLARAGAMIGSSRSYVYDTLAELFAGVGEGRRPEFAQRARWAGSVVNAGLNCRDAVQLLVDIVGSSALQRSCLLNRHQRDLNTMALHGLTQRRVWEWAGGLYFGHQPPLHVY